jgi:hypothetical protein
VDGVLNVWVGPADKPDAAKPITFDKHRGIVNYFWAFTNQHILYVQDKNGDEDNHVYAVKLADNSVKDLTPIEKIAAQIENVSEKFPEEILVGINDRDERQFHDIYRINILTGEKQLIQKNPGLAGFMTDDDYKVRFAATFLPNASQVLFKPDGEEWKPWITIPPTDSTTTSPAGFDKTGQKLYFMDSRNRNTACLKVIDLKDDSETLLAENDKADIGGVIAHPTEKNIQAVSFTYTRTEWQILDEAIRPDWLSKTIADGFRSPATLDDAQWTVAYLMTTARSAFSSRPPAGAEATFCSPAIAGWRCPGGDCGPRRPRS